MARSSAGEKHLQGQYTNHSRYFQNLPPQNQFHGFQIFTSQNYFIPWNSIRGVQKVLTPKVPEGHEDALFHFVGAIDRPELAVADFQIVSAI
jgi:hypothetical protein